MRLGPLEGEDSYSIYLDHNATTPIDPRVLDAMMPYLDMSHGLYANASSSQTQWSGKLQDAVSEARCHVANLIGAKPHQIIFTSGSTESNNLAVKGLYKGCSKILITSQMEHKAVLEAHEYLPDVLLKPNKAGSHDALQLSRELRPWCHERCLVSIMLANNEVGVVNPIRELSEAAMRYGAAFHCDATQGLGYVPFDVSEMPGLSMASLSSHKLYGPKGIGALYVSDNTKEHIIPMISGGGHEQGLRSGTTNVPAIVGFGEACRIMAERGKLEAERLEELTSQLWTMLNDGLDGVWRTGEPFPGEDAPRFSKRLPHTLHVTFLGVENEVLLMMLPHIAMSTGSACSAQSTEPSHVVRSLFPKDDPPWTSSVRMSVGRFTTSSEVAQVAADIIQAVGKARDIKEETSS